MPKEYPEWVKNLLSSAKDQQEGAAALLKAIRKSPTRYKQVMHRFDERICYEVAGQFIRKQRANLWHDSFQRPDTPHSESPEGLSRPTPITPNICPKGVSGETMSKINSREISHFAGLVGLMAFPLPGGKMLAEATHEERVEAIQFYRTQGRDMLAKADWLEIVDRAAGKKRLRETGITAQQLADFQKRARDMNPQKAAA